MHIRTNMQPMTEDQIERHVERMVNRLDARFLREGSPMTQSDYDAEMKQIGQWADAEYRLGRNGHLPV